MKTVSSLPPSTLSTQLSHSFVAMAANTPSSSGLAIALTNEKKAISTFVEIGLYHTAKRKGQFVGSANFQF
jgi:hypothetical protein